MKKRLKSWLAPCLCLGLACQNSPAADPPTALAAAPSGGAASVASPSLDVGGNTSFSGTSFARRAPWQQHLTLGSGDILDFALYLNDAPSQARENVVIGPDGRVSYLQAVDIVAAGLTIDELRSRMDAELGKYYRLPRTIITPVAITSKKYFILGSVVNQGAYVIDRPLSLIEALGRAGGLQTGVFDHNPVELTDLSRSFMVRSGQKLSVDFERLFQQGDLAQNIAVEPNDYLYFASSSANEVYVLGVVQVAGIVPYTANLGAVGAISSRGGFGDKAYRSKVLIIRGSLSNPELFVINTHEVLDGKAPDFRLKPRDIVYVSRRPWAKAEELLDEGTRAFIEALIVTYTGVKVGPFINPIIH
jgi:protein involved in polysaccharide export with SLBB domain